MRLVRGSSGTRSRYALRILAGLALLAGFALPLVCDDFFIFELALALVSMLAVLGLNILVGFTGQISLGHGAFYALGAYTAALLVGSVGIPYWLTLPLAAALCFVAGFLFGFPALRLAGHYLALATFALSICLPQLLKWQALEWLTGGAQGIVLDKPAAPAFVPLNPDQWLYCLTLAVTLLMFVLAHRLVTGRIGRAMCAVRDHPVAAAAMGIDIALVKTVTFGISAAYAGLAGALSAILVQFVSPDSYTMFLSISLLIGVAVGGMGTVAGAVFGGLFIQFVPSLADQVSKSATWAVYGVMLLVVGLLMRGGIEGALRALLGGCVRKVRGDGAGRTARELSAPTVRMPDSNSATRDFDASQ